MWCALVIEGHEVVVRKFVAVLADIDLNLRRLSYDRDQTIFSIPALFSLITRFSAPPLLFLLPLRDNSTLDQ